MVYCTKCGTKNEDDVEVCSKCNTPLKVSRREKRYRSKNSCFGSQRTEDECFGLPHGGAIIGLIFGAFIIIIGLAMVLGFEDIWSNFWYIIIIIIGVLFVSGALYGMRRRN